jgi:ABC-type transport system substrate-binding protein
MNYTIDNETFAINIYDGVNPEPFWYQPDYPNGDKFDSYNEAESWAELAIKSMDAEYLYFPPNGKNLEPKAKPTPQEIAQAKLQKAGLSVDELKLLLNE